MLEHQEGHQPGGPGPGRDGGAGGSTQADRLVLSNFMDRFKETSQEGDVSSQQPYAQIVSYAQFPASPERPKKVLLVVIAGMASLITGALLAFLVENSDRTLHSLEEVETLLKITGLGTLPFSKAAQLSPSDAARYGSSYREAPKAVYSRIFCRPQAPKVTVEVSMEPDCQPRSCSHVGEAASSFQML